MSVTSRLLVAALTVITVLTTHVAAQGRRLNDKEVESLLERIDHERDRFEDQLDGELKRTTLRGPAGDVQVDRFLDDLQQNVGNLKDRFDSKYAANTEASTVLRQGSDIDRFMATRAADFDGASEWKRLSASLGELAAVYGAPWPMPTGAQARRMNDDEVQATARSLADNADKFKKAYDSALKGDPTVDKARREAAVGEVERLKKTARELASAVGDDRPATGEVTALFHQAETIRTGASARTMPAAAQSSWTAVESDLDKLATAFGLTRTR